MTAHPALTPSALPRPVPPALRLVPTSPTAGSGRFARLRAWWARPAGDPSWRAGVERPAPPMLHSISLGGAARMR